MSQTINESKTDNSGLVTDEFYRRFKPPYPCVGGRFTAVKSHALHCRQTAIYVVRLLLKEEIQKEGIAPCSYQTCQQP